MIAQTLLSADLMSVTLPCGHTIPIEQCSAGTDQYACPACGMRCWIAQDAPTIYPTGFIMPGDRHIVIESQSNLPNLEL